LKQYNKRRNKDFRRNLLLTYEELKLLNAKFENKDYLNLLLTYEELKPKIDGGSLSKEQLFTTYL